MLNLINPKTNDYEFLNNFDINTQFAKLKEIYGISDVSEERKEYLSKTIKKYGYLPYAHFKTLDELTTGEIIFTFCPPFASNKSLIACTSSTFLTNEAAI